MERQQRADEEQTGRCMVVVGILADPGLVEEIVADLERTLPDLLGEWVSADVTWLVDVVQEPFEAIPRFDRVIDRARTRVENTNWDYALCLTDLPLTSEKGHVVAEVSRSDRVALMSLPALGGLRLRSRARKAAVAVLDELITSPLGSDGAENGGRTPTGRVEHDAPAGWVRRVEPGDSDIDVEMVARPFWGAAHTVAGMVRANQPWRLALGLSTALAGAAAGAAFGILYSSVWMLADALQPWRHVLVTVGTMTIFTAWLIMGHELWERQRQPGRPGHLLNLATLITVGGGVVLFAVLLFAVVIVAAVLVIPPEFLSQTLGRPISASEYVRVALLATDLGIVAGAVGSGLENDRTVQNAAYGTRERQRREQIAAAEERTDEA